MNGKQRVIDLRSDTVTRPTPEMREAMARAEVGDDPDFNLRGFECLGACDIAPMASVNGDYVGPITLDEVPALVAQIRAGEEPLPARQLTARRSADPKAAGSDA